MQADGIDHLNLRIPADGVDRATAFYRDALGFEIEGFDRYPDEKPFFDVRLTAGSVLHLWPTDDFEKPTRENFDHVCLRLRDDVESIESTLDDAGIAVENRSEPLGATGVAPAVYVRDPFGYRIELKTTTE